MNNENDIEKSALNIIKFSNQFRKILKQKLLAKNFTSEQIDNLLDRYEEIGLINDYTNGKSYASELINNSLYGKNIVVKKLYEKLDDKELINTIISEIYTEYSDEETCRKYIEKKIKTVNLNKDTLVIINKQLINHGFDFKTIRTIIKEIDDGLKPDYD